MLRRPSWRPKKLITLAIPSHPRVLSRNTKKLLPFYHLPHLRIKSNYVASWDLLTSTVSSGITDLTSSPHWLLLQVTNLSGFGDMTSRKHLNGSATLLPVRSFLSILTLLNHLTFSRMPLTFNLVLSSVRMDGLLLSTHAN